MGQIPGAIQRATAMVNPAQPIKALASPAYVPPPADFIVHAKRGHGGGQNGGKYEDRYQYFVDQ